MPKLRWPPRAVRNWLLLGLAVREALCFWTGHPFDMEVWLRNAYYVAHGWSPYQDMPPVPGVSFAYTGGAIPSVGYLPLWSLLLGLLYDLYALVPGGSRFLLYGLVKQPSVLGDVFLGYVLWSAVRRWGGTEEQSLRVLRYWMLFPYAIFISAVWGQFDALVAAVWLASLLIASPAVRESLLGFGILLKSIPLVWLPYEALRLRGLRRGYVGIAFALPVGFTLAAFLLGHWPWENFVGTVSYQAAGGTPQGLAYGRFLTDPAVAPYLPSPSLMIAALGYAWIPAIVAATWWARKRIPGTGPEAAVATLVFLLAVFFLVRWQVNEQYLIYLLPPLLVDVVLWHPERRSLYRWAWGLASLFLIVNNVFLVRFLSPVDPGAIQFEANLIGIPAFMLARRIFLDAVAAFFIVLMVQLGLTVVNPRRDPTPWPMRLVRRASGGRRARSPEIPEPR